MLNAIKRLMRRLTPAEVAARELGDAELSLLEARSGEEFAAAMVAYHQARIKRLRAFLANLERDKA
jgi:hypothetical protein